MPINNDLRTSSPLQEGGQLHAQQASPALKEQSSKVTEATNKLWNLGWGVETANYNACSPKARERQMNWLRVDNNDLRSLEKFDLASATPQERAEFENALRYAKTNLAAKESLLTPAGENNDLHKFSRIMFVIHDMMMLGSKLDSAPLNETKDKYNTLLNMFKTFMKEIPSMNNETKDNLRNHFNKAANIVYERFAPHSQ